MRSSKKSPFVYVFKSSIIDNKGGSCGFIFPSSINIFVCDAHGLGKEKFNFMIQKFDTIKAPDDKVKACGVFIFSAVSSTNLNRINKKFSKDLYWIFEQAYPKLEGKFSDNKLVILFKKNPILRKYSSFDKAMFEKPESITVEHEGRPIQSFICKLTLGYMYKKFILHAAHLNLDGKLSIHEVEKYVVEKIFVRKNKDLIEKYFEILAGDLSLPVLTSEGCTNGITALTYDPNHNRNYKVFNDRWRVSCGSFHSVILSDLQPEPIQDISQLTLLSQFGVHYRCESGDLSSAYYPEKGELYLNLEEAINWHVQNYLGYDSNKYFVNVWLAFMPGEDPLRHYLVLNIPEKLWVKLGVFIDTRNMMVKELQGGRLLSTAVEPSDGENVVKYLKNAIKVFREYKFSELERKISGLSVELYRRQASDAIFFKFVAEPVDGELSELAEQIAAYKSPFVIDDAKTKSFIEDLIRVIGHIDAINKEYGGFVTANLVCLNQKDATYHVKLKFLNSAIARFLRSTGMISLHDGKYSVKPLEHHAYYKPGVLQNDSSLLFPFEVLSERTAALYASPTLPSSKDSKFLKQVLLIQIVAMINCLPFAIRSKGMKVHQPSTILTAGPGITAEKILPYALAREFSLGKPRKEEELFFYPAVKIYTEIASQLFQKYFNVQIAITDWFKNYSGRDAVLQELVAVSKARGNDVFSACEELSKYCDTKILLIEQGSRKKKGFFSVPTVNKTTVLLYQSIKNMKVNFEFSCHAGGDIQNLQQLVNTQEKRMLVKLCKKERKHTNGEPYNRFQRNSALLLLEHYLTLSHPAYTAKEVWENIQSKSVEYYGTGKNYPHRSGDRDLTLEEILRPVTKICNALSSLVTSNNVAAQAETLRK